MFLHEKLVEENKGSSLELHGISVWGYFVQNFLDVANIRRDLPV
jgi:hypothetical protein